VKLLIDEMYSPEIAEQLRDRGHDVVSAYERPELAAALDTDIFHLMQVERRVILTNNHRHFAPLANAALQAGETLHGIVFTADRSLPRDRKPIPLLIELLDEFLNAHHEDEKLATGIEWIVRTAPAKR
jgi:predicted nuclease of predicted toxin-antitoxin system